MLLIFFAGKYNDTKGTAAFCVPPSLTLQRHEHGAFTVHHPRGSRKLGCRPRLLPPRGVGPRRCVQRARRGVAVVGGVQSIASGGEGVSRDPPAVNGVRRIPVGGWRGDSERGGGAQSGDDAVGGHACSFARTLQPRVLRGEGCARRPGRFDSTR